MIETRTCDCGAVYEVTKICMPVPSDGGFECRLCGDAMASWSGTMTMFFRYLKGGTGYGLATPTPEAISEYPPTGTGLPQLS